MVQFIRPVYSKSRVNRAGQAFRSNAEGLDDMIALENWRAAHAYVLNTFQANLRSRARKINAIVGQRLKRRPTIIDKLCRQPHMQLARMHDIAGCRVIFKSIGELEEFRSSMLESRFKHERVTADRDQFNYLIAPKPSGYRGVHDVYRYASNQRKGSYWDGLLIEIQYRTKIQHAWATAVETADLLNRSRVKFSDAAPQYERFFSLASELLARYFEGEKSCHPEIDNSKFVSEFNSLEADCNILRLLRSANRLSPNQLKGSIEKGKIQYLFTLMSVKMMA